MERQDFPHAPAIMPHLLRQCGSGSPNFSIVWACLTIALAVPHTQYFRGAGTVERPAPISLNPANHDDTFELN